MKYAFLSLTSALTFVAQGVSYAQTAEEVDQLIIIGARTPVNKLEIGSAVSVIDAQDIEDRQASFIPDLLRDLPGLAVSRTGTVGGATQVRIRGAEGNHTLVFIDGIEANDPAFGSEFDFSGLTASGIDRIEVLRGPQSALWGSEAIGGVINIVTKGGEKGLGGSVEGEGGSFGTIRTGGLIRAGSDRARFAASANYFDNKGINTAQSGTEKDGYENLTLHLKGSVDAADNLSFKAALRYIDAEVETDAQDFNFGSPTQGLVVDTNDVTKSRQFFGRIDGSLAVFDGLWRHDVFVTLTDTDNDNFTDDAFSNSFKGERVKYGYQSVIDIDDNDMKHTFVGALEREELKFQNIQADPANPANQRQKDDQTSFIGEYRFGFIGRLFFTAGGRFDDNDRFKNATTYRLTTAYLIPDSGARLHASFGTGITNPGFFELFGFIPASFTGNPGLRPEKAVSFDLGVEQSFRDDRAAIDITYFHANLKREITTVFDPLTFAASPINLDGKSKRQGVEITLAAELMKGLRFDGSYTYTDTDQPDGLPEIRRAKHIASGALNHDFAGGRGNINLGLRYNGKQQDSEFIFATPETRVTLDSFALVHAAASYEIHDGIELYGRVENLFDADNVEVFSHRAPGIGAFGGLRFRFGE